LVTPERHAADDLLHQGTKLTGPTVELSRIEGGTSGRFAVAKIAARIFPAAKAFVQQVIDEGIIPKEEFISGPYPDDRLVRRSDTEVEFATPGGREGMGTGGKLTKNDQLISGVAILLPSEDMGLVMLRVRLPPEMRSLSPTIVMTVEHGVRSE
jgi:hypothetical protein